MKVYLIQHGEAYDKETDPERPLTGKGTADVQKVANLLAQAGFRVGLVWHSGKARARQTAELVGKTLAARQIDERGDLGPKDAVEPVEAALKDLNADVAVVGHLPFLSKLAGRLLAGSEEAEPIAFEKGGIVCLEKTTGSWHITWMVVPALLPPA